ncbi:MAG: hypothetical protein ACI8VT_002113 [Saprospiraceae bacterium]
MFPIASMPAPNPFQRKEDARYLKIQVERNIESYFHNTNVHDGKPAVPYPKKRYDLLPGTSIYNRQR